MRRSWIVAGLAFFGVAFSGDPLPTPLERCAKELLASDFFLQLGLGKAIQEGSPPHGVLVIQMQRPDFDFDGLVYACDEREIDVRLDPTYLAARGPSYYIDVLDR